MRQCSTTCLLSAVSTLSRQKSMQRLCQVLQMPATYCAGLSATVVTISAGAWRTPTRSPLGRSTDTFSQGSAPVQMQQRGHPQDSPCSSQLACSPMLAGSGIFTGAAAYLQRMPGLEQQLPFAAQAAYHSKAKSGHRRSSGDEHRHMRHTPEQAKGPSIGELEDMAYRYRRDPRRRNPRDITQLGREVRLETHSCGHVLKHDTATMHEGAWQSMRSTLPAHCISRS